MYNKTVGIYMPTHNRVELLKKAVTSVLNQTYQNFKLVVVNDGSSDGTHEFLDSLADPRITAIHHDKAQGACSSRNKAIEALDTELVTGLDDDDVFLPHRLEQLLSVYDEKYAFVCSGYFWDYGAHKKVLFNNDRTISLSDAFDLNQCSNQILVKRERIIAVECFDKNIPALQDHDLWVRLIAKYGAAYRTGEASYIVNDDHSLERISSVKNKLNAIAMFEKKHNALMSKRNKANFEFYKSKIRGDEFGLFDFIKSTQFGLLGLKSRQYLSQYFKTASQLRLNYLQTGQLGQSNLFQWFFNALLPLLATGGPGASRVILLSACIFFLGAEESSSFSGDFFVIMLLNTAFSQCYGFFLLKPDYKGALLGVIKQSTYGLTASLIIAVMLFYVGLLSELGYSIGLLVVLHYYYIYRFKNIANHYFKPMAIAEVLISLSCLILPFLASVYDFNAIMAPYQIYLFSSLIGLLTVRFLTRDELAPLYQSIPFKNLRNISISTTASIFAIFILPASIKAIAEPHIVSIVALTISCMSISMLIPRTYANKIMRQLALNNLESIEFYKLSNSYRKLLFVSAFTGLCFTVFYLYVINTEIGGLLYLVPLGVGAMLVSAQLGFISLTFLSLQGADQQVAKMNLAVLIVTAIFTIPVMLGLFTAQVLIYAIVTVACASFIIRNKLALGKAPRYLT